MADRIDIFGEGEGVAEPEVPTFLGVEQEKLTKPQYSGEFVDFFSQYYGMEALDGLGDTGVGIEEPETITDLTKPTDILEGGRDESDRGTFDSVGIDFGNPKDLSFDYSGGTTSFDSYSDYLKTNADMYDRVPLTEFFMEPVLTGNFSDIDFSEAAFGEYKSIETSVKEAPGKLGDILKGEMTEEQKKGLIASTVATYGGPLGLALAPIISGTTVKNAFGNNSLRPSGPLGLMADAVHSIQYNDMAQIRAAHAVNSAFQSGSLPDELTTGSLPSVTGFAMSFSAGFGITRAPGTSTYTGNFNGLSREQVKAMDALKHGMIPKGFVPETETGTTLVEAGWVGTGATDAGGKSLGKAGGYYTSNGSFYSVNTNTYSAYGLKESAEAAAAKAGISPEAFNAALAAARKGTATLEEGVRKAQQDKLNKAEADRQAAATEAVAKAAATASKAEYDRVVAEHGGQDNGVGGNEAGYGAGGGYGLSHARGGKVGYAFGTPDGGVQAPSGFIDAPPSQVPEGQKVADNRDMEVPEGTYILNAAAVEFAGEQDIRKMIMDAQKEAVRRGLSTEDFERHSDLIDIAVSSGEVTIAPHLVKIIGEDRLEKINNRGLRKTEERIAQNGQQPVGAAGGGFIDKKGDKVVPLSNPLRKKEALADVELRADLEEYMQDDNLARLGFNLYEKGLLDINAIVLPRRAKEDIEVGTGGMYTPAVSSRKVQARRVATGDDREMMDAAQSQGVKLDMRKPSGGISYFVNEASNYSREDANLILIHELRHAALDYIANTYNIPEDKRLTISREEHLFDAQDYMNRKQARKVKPSIPKTYAEPQKQQVSSSAASLSSTRQQLQMYQDLAQKVLQDRKVPKRTKSKEVEGFVTRAMGLLGL